LRSEVNWALWKLFHATQGAFFAGRCPALARKLFEKSFLDLQKLLKMGITKPRPSGEVAAVRLTERVLCATPLRRTPPPPRRAAPSNKNNALTSLVQARLGQALFLLLVLWTMAVREAIAHNFGNNAFTKRFAQTR